MSYFATYNNDNTVTNLFICLIISCVVHYELVIGPPSGLDTVRAPTGLVLHVNQGSNRQLLKY